jgi:hypothetical protein
MRLTGFDATPRGSAGPSPTGRPFTDSATALAALASRYRLFILSNVDRESFAASRRLDAVTAAGPGSA